MVVVTAAAALGAKVFAALSITGAFATGVTFATVALGFLTQAALGFALNALTPKPKIRGANRGYQVNARGSALDHQIIYGEARVGGVIIFEESVEGQTDDPNIDNQFLLRVYAHAGHEVEGYQDVYIDGKKVTEWRDANDNIVAGGPSSVPNGTLLVPYTVCDVRSDGTVIPEEEVSGSCSNRYGLNSRGARVNNMTLRFYDGTQTTADANLVADSNGSWNTDCVLNETAYMVATFAFDAEVYPNGVPEITCTIKGKKCFDPRSGTTAYSQNPAICIRDYLTNSYGLNEDAANIDDTLVATAADVCDETVEVGINRFACNGAFVTSVEPADILADLLTSMGGLLWYSQGKWRMKPAYWTAPSLTLTEDDLRSNVAVKTRHSRRDNFNIVKGTFRGPETNWQVTDYPEVPKAGDPNPFLTADNDQESVVDLDLPFTDNSKIARRIARIFLERNRQQLTISATFGMRAFGLQIGDNVRLSLERFGWVEKTFEVNSWTFGLAEDNTLQVQMTLREISESVFDDVDDGAVFELDNTTLADPFLVVAPTNLSTTNVGLIKDDGSFDSSLLVTWDINKPALTRFFYLEYRESQIDYDAQGGFVTLSNPTAREQLVYDAYLSVLFRVPGQSGFDYYVSGAGSSLTEEEVIEELRNSAENANQTPFNSFVVETNQFDLRSITVDKYYDIKVTSVNTIGVVSEPAVTTVLAEKDTTAPPTPTYVDLTTDIIGKQVTLRWINPDDGGVPVNDLRLTEVWRSESSTLTLDADGNPTNATLVGKSTTEEFIDTSGATETTYYYFVRAVDYTGNKSAFDAGREIITNAAAGDGNAGLTPSVAPSSVVLTSESDGSVVSYSGSGCIISLFEDNTALSFTTADPLTADSTWRISGTEVFTDGVASSDITVGSASVSGDDASVANHSGMSGSVDSVVIRYTIQYRRADSSEGNLVVSQTVAKAFKGLNNAEVYLYNKNTSGSTPPTDPSGGSWTYTFSSGSLVASGVTTNGWSASPPTLSQGEYLWRLQAVASSSTDTASVSTSSFLGTESVVAIAGTDGADGVNGTDGVDGKSVAQVQIFKRSATAPATPSGGYFSFSSNTLVPPSGWSSSVPSGTDPVYSSIATAAILGTSGTDFSLSWSTPEILARDGTDGVDGTNGDDGLSTYQAVVFRRDASTPATPTGGSFDFGANTLTPPTGWSADEPASDGNPLYASRYLFQVVGDTGTDTAGTWSVPSLYVQDGADGLSSYLITIFQRSASAPATPTGGSYDFGTETLTPPSGWSDDYVASDGNPLYTSTALASVQGTTGTDSTLTWTAPKKVLEDGTDGATGDTTITGRVYYQTLTGTQPSTPSATSYDTSTGLFSGLTAGWAVTQPPVEITDTSVQEWSSGFTVTVDGDTGSQTINFTTPTGAIQVTTDIQSDNYVAGSSGWTIERDTGFAEFGSAAIRDTLSVGQIPVLPQSQVTDLESDLAIGSGRASTFFQSSAPTANNEGDIWHDTTNDKIKRWNGSDWVPFSILADSILANDIVAGTLDAGVIYTGTLTSAQVNAVDIDASSITVGTLNANRINIDGVTLDTDLSDNLIIKDNGVSEVVSNTGSVLSGSSTASYQTAASVNLTVPTGLTGDILLLWSFEQTYPNGFTGPEWGLRIKDGATVLYNRTAMQAAADFPSGHIEVSGATGAKTYTLEWWSEEPTANEITGQGTLTAFARWK